MGEVNWNKKIRAHTHLILAILLCYSIESVELKEKTNG
jgi:hypothetical protein